MAQRYDMMVARPGKDGKTYWTKIGTLWPLRDRDGFSLQFEALPIPTMKDGQLEVRAVCFPPRDRDGGDPQPAARAATSSRRDDLDDEVPF